MSPFEAAVQGEHALPRACPLLGAFCPAFKVRGHLFQATQRPGQTISSSRPTYPFYSLAGRRGSHFQSGFIFNRANPIFPINGVENMGEERINQPRGLLASSHVFSVSVTFICAVAVLETTKGITAQTAYFQT